MSRDAKTKERTCPDCGMKLLYSIKNFSRAVRQNSRCKSCSKSGKRNPSVGVPIRNNQQLMALRKGNKWNLGKYRTPEQRRIHSQKLKAFCATPEGILSRKKATATLRRTRELLGTNGYHPNFNKDACRFFDYLNEQSGWKGKHALNGGEHYIWELGYWVDYYEPTQNLVIEWDEKYIHFQHGQRVESDVTREKQIRETLNCQFIRLNETPNYEQAKDFILSHCT